ncbi:MAG TPA: DNA-processing protein DprA [Ramlibacter sp.]|nr:DNA-processing protein DprA [Ramlibacter sp.]
MDREELAAWLRLTLTPGVGNGAARKLLAAFGLPAAVFGQTLSILQQVVTGTQAQALQAAPPGHAALLEATLQWLQDDSGNAHRRILTLADSAYPPALLQTEDPPLVLYAMGVEPLSWPASIAIVGSRNPTAQGLTNARQFSRTFVESGLTVVSGLALGVDGAAHEGALEAAAAGQLATIAVVGTGLDRVYPKQHLQLAHRIVQQGLIVSEYPIGTPPLSENFPRRNRIIAALSQGTVVVEAALKSGSLITARQAVEQGKDVFAIPGSIHSPQSRGCHALLKQGAKLVETAQDVLEELRDPQAAAKARDAAAAEGGTEDEGGAEGEADSLLHALGFDPASLDALVARTGIAPALLQGQLLELELQGAVARLPGGLYQRVASS